jgi:hypothetical protein
MASVNYNVPVYPTIGDMVNINGTTLTYDGHQWTYPYYQVTTTGTSTISTTLTNGDNMNTQMNNLYGDHLLFTRDWGYEPWTVTDIKTGKIAGKVHEIRRGTNNGLKSDSSLYSILDTAGKVTYPFFNWNALLEKLGG